MSSTSKSGATAAVRVVSPRPVRLVATTSFPHVANRPNRRSPNSQPSLTKCFDQSPRARQLHDLIATASIRGPPCRNCPKSKRSSATCGPHLAGRRIVRVRAGEETAAPRRGRPTGTRLLAGRRIAAVRRRGKWILLDLDDGLLVVHLGMTGRLTVGPPIGRSKITRISSPTSTTAAQLRFRDVRRFGSVTLLRRRRRVRVVPGRPTRAGAVRPRPRRFRTAAGRNRPAAQGGAARPAGRRRRRQHLRRRIAVRGEAVAGHSSAARRRPPRPIGSARRSSRCSTGRSSAAARPSATTSAGRGKGSLSERIPRLWPDRSAVPTVRHADRPDPAGRAVDALLSEVSAAAARTEPAGCRAVACLIDCMSYRAFKRLLGETSLERQVPLPAGHGQSRPDHRQLLVLRPADRGHRLQADGQQRPAAGPAHPHAAGTTPKLESGSDRRALQKAMQSFKRQSEKHGRRRCPPTCLRFIKPNARNPANRPEPDEVGVLEPVPARPEAHRGVAGRRRPARSFFYYGAVRASPYV